jgi:hypothetical protein
MHRWASINCKWDLGFKTILSAHFKLSHIKYQIGPSPLNELIPNHFILLISKSFNDQIFIPQLFQNSH